ncbi:hypothetical protein QWZ10_24240 [Paracoccus cavernae]|uniref:Uncharacterized protein n=1 Tax=Paracoccus cavernae TaxID=1571207 RepID=A0ABT8DG63_9RHOB|nr:hypothetical protein [Paracoccus cavernae]
MVSYKGLAERGVEVLPRGGGTEFSMPQHTVLEAPSSLKWTVYENSIELGAFSYQVSGFCAAARIGSGAIARSARMSRSGGRTIR